MTTPILADSGEPILPALWRIERHLVSLADQLAQRHRATLDLLAAYGASVESCDRLEVLLGDDPAVLRMAAAELQRIRHVLDKVLP